MYTVHCTVYSVHSTVDDDNYRVYDRDDLIMTMMMMIGMVIMRMRRNDLTCLTYRTHSLMKTSSQLNCTVQKFTL